MDWNHFIISKEISSSKPKLKGHWAHLNTVLDDFERHTLEHMLAETNQRIAQPISSTPQIILYFRY